MKRFFFIILLALCISFIFPVKAEAINYDIEKVRIQAEIKPNGVIHVYESYTYNFSSSFNGITRRVYPKKDSYIDNFTATENVKQLDVELKDQTFYIHRAGEAGEVVRINIFYLIHNGLEIYEDVVQFYWPFIDDRNDSDFGDLEIIIYPPENTELLDVLGYDEAKDTEEILNDGVVSFSFGRLKAEKNADIRLLYNASSFSPISLTEEKEMKESLITEFKQDRKKQERKAERTEKLKGIGDLLFPILGIVLLVMFLMIWLKRKFVLADVERTYQAASFVPDEHLSLPAMILFMSKTKQVFSQMLTVAFLDLIRRRLVRQIDSKTFSLISKETPYDHEIFLMNWLFEKVGKKGTLHISQLEAYVDEEKTAIEFQQDIGRWEDLIKLEISKHELRDVMSIPRVLAMVLEVFLPIFIIVFALHGLFGYMALALIFNLISTFILILYKPKTAQGIILERDWKQFVEKYIHEGDIYLPEITEEERARAYLYSFALQNERLDQLNEKLAKDFELGRLSSLDSSYYLIFTKEATQYFQEAYERSRVHYMTSTASGARGGGVGGGGGGAGAF